MTRIYRSFEEFERVELNSLERFYDTIDDAVDDMFSLDFEGYSVSKRRRRDEDDDE